MTATTTRTRTITATVYYPEVPERFAPVGPRTEWGMTRVCVCGVTVQTRIGKNDRPYVARVETRLDWKGAYFRGLHTREECQARWEDRLADRRAQAEKDALGRASAADGAYVRTVLNRYIAIFGQETLAARWDDLNVSGRMFTPEVVYVAGS